VKREPYFGEKSRGNPQKIPDKRGRGSRRAATFKRHIKTPKKRESLHQFKNMGGGEENQT